MLEGRLRREVQNLGVNTMFRKSFLIVLIILFIFVFMSCIKNINEDKKNDTVNTVDNNSAIIQNNNKKEESIDPFIMEFTIKINNLFEQEKMRYRIFDFSKASGGAHGESTPNYEYDKEMISGIADSMIINKKIFEDEIIPKIKLVLGENTYDILYDEASDLDDRLYYQNYALSLILINKETKIKYRIWPCDFSKEYLFFIMN